MKLKKSLILVIISIILISIPAEIFAWTTTKNVTYEVCNMINVCISGTLRIVAFVLAIIYIVSISKYIKNSKEEPKQKMNKIKVSTIITIIEIVLLLFGASFVIEVGIETYTKGETYQMFSVESLIPNVFRIIAFVAIFFYIIKSIIYFMSPEEDSTQKIIIPGRTSYMETQLYCPNWENILRTNIIKIIKHTNKTLTQTSKTHTKK